MGLAIGVDIGGTKVAAGVVNDAGEVLARTRRDTAREASEAVKNVIDVIWELSGKYPVEAVGVGAAGWMNPERSRVLFAPNLPWRDVPLPHLIAEAIDVPVFVENDGNVAAWGEFKFGAAKDATDSMALFTVGTGIGGGVVLNGEVLKGAHGIAGELGHARVVPDGHQCACGRCGCLEQYASGNALVRFAKATARSQPDCARILLDAAHGEVDDITGPMVTAAARAGDPASLAAFQRVGSWLGPAMVDLVQIIDPQVVVIGGGVAEAGDLLFEPAHKAYQDALAQRGRTPVAPVRLAAMGNTAGVVGAADLARRRVRDLANRR